MPHASIHYILTRIIPHFNKIERILSMLLDANLALKGNLNGPGQEITVRLPHYSNMLDEEFGEVLNSDGLEALLAGYIM